MIFDLQIAFDFTISFHFTLLLHFACCSISEASSMLFIKLHLLNTDHKKNTICMPNISIEYKFRILTLHVRSVE